MSPLPLGILAASIPGGAYWIGYLNNAGDDYGTGCDYDADGNVYFCSGINTGSGLQRVFCNGNAVYRELLEIGPMKLQLQLLELFIWLVMDKPQLVELKATTTLL
jgi:hypothetical protein